MKETHARWSFCLQRPLDHATEGPLRPLRANIHVVVLFTLLFFICRCMVFDVSFCRAMVSASAVGHPFGQPDPFSIVVSFCFSQLLSLERLLSSSVCVFLLEVTVHRR